MRPVHFVHSSTMDFSKPANLFVFPASAEALKAAVNITAIAPMIATRMAVPRTVALPTVEPLRNTGQILSVIAVGFAARASR
jgi:hypothetical protein